MENLITNNPIQPAVQYLLETRRLLGMGGAVNGAHALEIGCGTGAGTKLEKALTQVGFEVRKRDELLRLYLWVVADKA